MEEYRNLIGWNPKFSKIRHCEAQFVANDSKLDMDDDNVNPFQVYLDEEGDTDEEVPPDLSSELQHLLTKIDTTLCSIKRDIKANAKQITLQQIANAKHIEELMTYQQAQAKATQTRMEANAKHVEQLIARQQTELKGTMRELAAKQLQSTTRSRSRSQDSEDNNPAKRQCARKPPGMCIWCYMPGVCCPCNDHHLAIVEKGDVQPTGTPDAAAPAQLPGACVWCY